jgi:hypothetical protein
MSRERAREALRQYKVATIQRAPADEQSAWVDEQQRIAGWHGGGI